MRNSVLTLGTFDGVHRGHQRILRKVVERAQRIGARSVVLAFDMPPRVSRHTLIEPVLLTTLPDKQRLLKRLKIDRTEILIFNRSLASTPPETFFRKTFMQKHRASEIIVGPRVAFGRNRAGKLPFLRDLGRRYGVKIHVVPPVTLGGIPVSSSRIRELLQHGRVEEAGRLLGYPYSVSGQVVQGAHRGRTLGYPTANVAVNPHKILPPGVFWVKVFPAPDPFPFDQRDLRQGWNGLCNVGTRPTFTPREKKLHCEVFVFKMHAPLYDKTLRVVFLRRIRFEKRFRSASDLRQQIARDFQKAKKWSHPTP